jgi:D-amino-acid dehydrogenase
MSERHVIVVGGGIVGLCCAYFLARRGARVTLLEREGFDDSASAGNAGLLAVGHGPLPRPGLPARGLRMMFDRGSPLYIPPRVDADLVRWLWGFRRACDSRTYHRSMDLLAEHGWPAGACMRELIETEDIECEYRPIGQMDVFRTSKGMRGGEAEAAMLRDYGYGAELLDGDALRRREPAYRDDVVGAAVFTDRACADPGSFIAELAERVAARGATVRAGVEVDGLRRAGGRCTGVTLADNETLEADAVVLAAGIWSTDLARAIGVRIPMQAAKGYHMNLTAPDPLPVSSAVLAERFVAVTPMAGGLRLAGTLEFTGINRRIVEQRLEALRAGARLYLRGIDETSVQTTWCGLRPCTADGLPVVGWAPGIEGLFVTTGHAMMGFTLGPLAGRVAAECVLGDEASVDIQALSPGRFA